MIGRIFSTLFGRAAKAEAQRERLAADAMPGVLYAIGDVHGELEHLKALEAEILADDTEGERWIVMLGDYTDRGPQSAQVIDHLVAPLPDGWRRISLCGNHDHAMAMARHDPAMLRQWLSFGGVETLASYGIGRAALAEADGQWPRLKALLESHIPAEHFDFLDGLPILLHLPGHVFVHAGLRPRVPLERQADQDLLWIRPYEIPANERWPFTVVHGHTPVDAIDLTANTINLDTGAFATGILSALRIGADGSFKLLQTGVKDGDT